MKELLTLELANIIRKLRHILIDIEALQDVVKNMYLSDGRMDLICAIDKLQQVKL